MRSLEQSLMNMTLAQSKANVDKVKVEGKLVEVSITWPWSSWERFQLSSSSDHIFYNVLVDGNKFDINKNVYQSELIAVNNVPNVDVKENPTEGDEVAIEDFPEDRRDGKDEMTWLLLMISFVCRIFS